ncbi:MAG TPA: septum formation initiator family protein [Acidimicrobiales bacterium]|nr:septum formation initiator family protein [Acidimicrobiales bacterium]
MRRAAWPLVTSVVAVGILFLAVFPTRTYLAQRRGLTTAQERVRVLSEQNRQLASRVQKLNTDAEIERIAREQYDLVRPGEEAYAILPAPEPPAGTNQQAPAKVPKRHGGIVAQVLDRMAFWR